MTKQASRVERWAELADLALIISRELQYRGYSDERAISLTQSEGMVMRYLLEDTPAASSSTASGAAGSATGPSRTAAPSQIAAATGLQRTNLSTTLRGLEQKGLIERRADPADGRGVTVSPTDLGRTNYLRVRREWAIAIRQAAANDPTHLEAAITLLSTIKSGLADSRPPTPSRHPPA